MAKLDTYTCDGEGCTQQKKETNHWFVVRQFEDTIAILSWNARAADTDNRPMRDLANVNHICGIECLNKFIAKAASRIGAFNAEFKG